ncbi:MAG: hypothetical protein A2X94_10280 [Bdellovibrionales bacterium GWB1_55_8]|nr:MAG: hypothetical protein A2X94_10280 [Bdellovibrionales bacterium GWB1_55_8]
MLAESFSKPQKKLSVGDKIQGKILVLGKEDVFVSTGGANDAMMKRQDLLDADGKVPYQVGDTVEVYVTQIRGPEISVSTKKTAKNLADDLEDAADMMLPVEGRVAEICKGGFRVTLMGNKIAFCPISQMDTRRIEGGEEYIGKKFEFMITKFAEGGRNIVVSRRKLLEEQRGETEGSFAEEHKEGDVLNGTVTRIEKFGAFVSVAPDVDGLVHVSEIAWSRVNDPHEVLHVGQGVTVKLLKMENSEEGRLKISLSIKQAGTEPWSSLPSKIEAGQTIEGKVTRCVKFGAFVELAPGVEGLIPMSEMSYGRRVVRSDELVKEGERVTVMIKDVNPETHRISLSLKDAGGDPWAMVSYKFPVGTIVTGKLERREPYGLFIRIDDGVTGLLPKSKAMENAEFPFEKLKIGDDVTVQIGELRLEERRISFDVPGDPNAEDWKKHVQQSSGSLGTLGGSFGGAFGAALKGALENKDKKDKKKGK